MGTITAMPVRCTSCAGDGKCATCGGKGELDNGELCGECDGGLCLACVGTGQDLEFTVDGKPISPLRHATWTGWPKTLVGGAVLLAAGVVYSVLLLSGNAVERPYQPYDVLYAVGVAVGGALVVRWALGMRGLLRQERDLHSAFYEQAYEEMRAASDALEERRRARGQGDLAHPLDASDSE